MACVAVYSCRRGEIGSLIYHNVLINNEKWNYAENIGIGENMSTEREIKKMIESAQCKEDELIMFGFSKGWVKDCVL